MSAPTNSSSISLARERIGLDEAVFCAGKTPAQIAAILDAAAARGVPLLLTRLDPDKHRSAAGATIARRSTIARVSRTAFFGPPRPVRGPARVAVVAAGTSDVPVAREALRTLRLHGARRDADRRRRRRRPVAADWSGSRRSAAFRS